MDVHPNVDHTPSRIMHQLHPHQTVNLDHISASAHLIPEIHSAPAIMSEFPPECYNSLSNHLNVPPSPLQWISAPPGVPKNHPYPMYYTPYPVYQPFQPHHQTRSMTPKFKIEYLSIHATFLATIKEPDSLKDRKSWVNVKIMYTM
ncbi:hypothetical protein F5876DRAFT_82022 [Lentinula aff. lateritia]|uniref:Uncharacterized protein n=1 Tax=Lentinula aff. lateritia TaxID=2804960 RepID=A0ACC1TKT6_9AGAR|nr:hypothetical protein F5876DRAFT_82022 [Lentinula aff. lateritia]